MKKPTKNDLLSINAISAKTGIDRRTLAKHLADVKPAKVRGRVKFYTTADVLAVVKHLKPRQSPNADLERRKIQLQVDRLQSENDQAAGKLIPASEVQRSTRQYAVAARDGFLRLPLQLAQRLALLTEPAEVEAALRDAIRSGLTALAENPWPALTCPHCKKEIV